MALTDEQKEDLEFVCAMVRARAAETRARQRREQISLGLFAALYQVSVLWGLLTIPMVAVVFGKRRANPGGVFEGIEGFPRLWLFIAGAWTVLVIACHLFPED